jgi:serine/threonine-protein kinase
VHRDVKPDNVMLSGGAAVVTDFGIAKAVSAAQGDVPGGTITQTGVIIGTPAYMAPEQATGDPTTDHRADIYSFGCLAYELLAGKHQFAGRTTWEIIAAQLGTKPAPVTDARPDVPEAVSALIARCLEKDPGLRPQRADELVSALDAVQASGSPVRSRRPGARTAVLLAAATIVAVGGYVVARGRIAVGDDSRSQVTVAVLPFRSFGGDSLQHLVAEAFGDDIATALVKVPWVRVKSRGGAGSYREQRDIMPEATGRELGVRYLVTGLLREIGGKLTVRVNLMSDDGSVLYMAQFDPPAGLDLAAVRDEAVNAISDTLRSRAGVSAASRFPARTVAHRGDIGAYRDYLIGQAKLDQRGQSIHESIDLFKKALARDSLSAEAFSGLSFALALSPYFDPVSSETVAGEATDKAHRALRLDPRLAQPHITLGLVWMHKAAWDSAGSELRKATTANAHDVEARIQYGRYLLFQDKTADALAQFRKGRDDDPHSAVVSSWTAYAFFLGGQRDSAQAELARAMQIDPSSRATAAIGGLLFLSAGRQDAARQRIALLPPLFPVALYTLAAIGDTPGLNARLKQLDASTTKWSMKETSRAYALLGKHDTAGALDALVRATAGGEIWPTLHPVSDPLFDGIRGSARFRALLSQVGLPASVPSATAQAKGR